MTTLLDLVPGLHKLANTHGGEWAGPCPLCGGKDRFHLQPSYVWQDGDTGAWFCRQCSPHWQDAPALVMRLHNVRYPDALRILGQPPSPPGGRGAGGEGSRPPAAAVPPDPAWQARAAAFAGQAHDCLWSPAGERARAWLHQRGFTDAAIAEAQLGYHPGLYVNVRGHGDGYFDSHDTPTAWGLPDTAGKVWLPRGIVIPWQVDGALWNIEIRRPLTPAQTAQGDIKYVSIKGGSKQVLLGADSILSSLAPHPSPLTPVVLVEGAFDRLAIHQAAADLVTAAAAGSTTGARQSTWLTRLAPRQVLLAFDADDPGDQGAAWWLQVLGDRAVRWRPDPGYKDVADMLQAGADLHAWVEAGLALRNDERGTRNAESETSSLIVHPSSLSDTDPCAICGAPFDRYDPAGRPLCADHYAAWEAAETDWAQLGQRQTSEERGTMNDEPPSSLIPHRSPLPKLYPIPPRTKQQRCNCGMAFYWVVGPTDKPLPISVNVELHPDCVAPTHDTAGAGINHFADCPLRDGFRKSKPPALSHPLDQPHPQPTTTEAA